MHFCAANDESHGATRHGAADDRRAADDRPAAGRREQRRVTQPAISEHPSGQHFDRAGESAVI